MQFLVDTNVLVRTVKKDDPAHDTAVSALDILRGRGDKPVLVPQCCHEFYAVATRPLESNGLGFDPTEAVEDIDRFLGLYRFLRDERATFEEWLALVAANLVRGKSSHDARLVAAMRRHGIEHVLTFNVGDFSRFAGAITILDPADVAASA